MAAEDFTKLAQTYVRFRPQYPPQLFDYLAGLAPGRELAWDSGTGNGQAAQGLAARFRRVWATDISPGQVANAVPNERILYLVASAGQSGLPSRSVDLVTVAQALHWFDRQAFYAEVKRVLKPGGVLAAWSYGITRISPQIDALIESYFHDVLGPFWNAGIRLVGEKYRTISFPFQELTPPELFIEYDLDQAQLLGFLASWSAVPKFVEARGYHPLEDIRPALTRAWGQADRKRKVTWPLSIRVGIHRPEG